MVVEDVEESNLFWALFKLRRPRSTPSAEDILELCRSPDVCRSWSREDQIRLCYLAILTGGLLALDRREVIPPAQVKLLMYFETFEQYPWGRVAFVELVHQIKTVTESGKIKNSSYVHKGFVQVIQVWAYAYIPCVGEAIGCPISSHGICLLRFKGKGGKLSLSDTFNKAKVTCMCTRSLNEVHPVWEQQDEDPEIDNLLEFLRQHKSLSTITSNR
ncbi:Ulp1 protease family protein [Raphanus sativus]|nr:Ulp1 protease family protein [Raphanus sativus]